MSVDHGVLKELKSSEKCVAQQLAKMKYTAFAIFVILAALSPAKGRMLSEKAESPPIDPDNYNVISYNGTYDTKNFLLYKQTRAYFPDFGKNCTAYINIGGILIESPYMEGEIQLRIIFLQTSQHRDALKSVLCDFMRTGEYTSIAAGNILWKSAYRFYTDDNGMLMLDGSAASFGSMGGGTIHFWGCSC